MGLFGSKNQVLAPAKPQSMFHAMSLEDMFRKLSQHGFVTVYQSDWAPFLWRAKVEMNTSSAKGVKFEIKAEGQSSLHAALVDLCTRVQDTLKHF
jgi:hypothetical protein